MKMTEKLISFQNRASNNLQKMDFYQKLVSFVENNDYLSLNGLITSNSSNSRDIAKNEKKQSLLNKAAKIGNEKMVSLLLKFGFRFDTKDPVRALS